MNLRIFANLPQRTEAKILRPERPIKQVSWKIQLFFTPADGTGVGKATKTSSPHQQKVVAPG